MRSIYSCAAIIILLLPFFGTWLWLQGRVQAARYDARDVIKNAAGEQDLVLWKFTPEDSARLTWEHAREFKFHGEMYDVVRFEKRGDTTWYWCHHDRKETLVRKEIQSMLALYLGAGPQQQRDQQRILDFLKTLYAAQPGDMAMVIRYIAKGRWTDRPASVSDIPILPPSPPPEIG